MEAGTTGTPITVASQDLAWPVAIAAVAEQLRGECPFRYGDTIRIGEPISEESHLDGFLVFAPAIIDKDLARCDVGDRLPINIAGMYPVYDSEIDLLRAMPLEQFWHAADFDPYNVNRRTVSQRPAWGCDGTPV